MEPVGLFSCSQYFDISSACKNPGCQNWAYILTRSNLNTIRGAHGPTSPISSFLLVPKADQCELSVFIHETSMPVVMNIFLIDTSEPINVVEFLFIRGLAICRKSKKKKKIKVSFLLLFFFLFK